MNRSAFLTTGLAIKVLSRLSKADIVVHGKENIPNGPIIFVMNHFTRLETIILPIYIYELTGKTAYSLAASSLFQGGLEKFFDLVGVISTADPQRDQIILRSLLAGNSNWIIFPEGSMVKTKKIVAGGKYMIAHPDGMHEPRTGAASLALRAELFRRQLVQQKTQFPEQSERMLDGLGIKSLDEVAQEPVTIVPVNLTYYPIRAAENIALDIASRLVKDMSQRMVEEIMTEGTMLLSGVDIDIRFGKPVEVGDYLSDAWMGSDFTGFSVSEGIKDEMRSAAYSVMQRYMDGIYGMTTLNHEHLFATFLRKYPYTWLLESEFRRRVFYAASLVRDHHNGLDNPVHKALKKNQAHLLTDDRYKKYKNFLQLALEKGVVTKNGEYLVRDRSKLSVPLSLHRGRISNPVEVMANEIEPLKDLQKLIRRIAWQPDFLIRFSVGRYLYKKDQDVYLLDCEKYGRLGDGRQKCLGKPFLLPGLRRTGVVLVHSYLAVPKEVWNVASALRKKGYWVYGVRLPGHGTSAADLSNRHYHEWVEAVENGYALLGSFCREVVVGGFGVGGNLSLDLAARVEKVKGVFAICPPFSLKNYSTNFMPAQDVWNRILNKIKRGEAEGKYLDFSHGNSLINYTENPVKGIRELGEYLESISKRYQDVKQPAFIVQAGRNTVVDPKGSRKIYNRLGSTDKEFCLLSTDHYVLMNGESASKVARKIVTFIQEL